MPIISESHHVNVADSHLSTAGANVNNIEVNVSLGGQPAREPASSQSLWSRILGEWLYGLSQASPLPIFALSGSSQGLGASVPENEQGHQRLPPLTDGQTSIVPLEHAHMYERLALPTVPTRQPHEIYVRQLYPTGNGYPCANPMPWGRPIQIGDIGKLESDGFRVLQNLYTLPDDFLQGNPVPIVPTVSEAEAFVDGDTITGGVDDSKVKMASSVIDEIVIHCPEEEGAALAITSPAELLRMESNDTLRDYLCNNASRLFDFLLESHSLPEGTSIYIVTGTVLSASWATATYNSRMNPSYNSLVLKRIAGDGSQPPYFMWTEKGNARTRTQGRQLRVTKDQCLFLKGFLLDASPEVWKARRDAIRLKAIRQERPDLRSDESRGGTDSSTSQRGGSSTTRQGVETTNLVSPAPSSSLASSGDPNSITIYSIPSDRGLISDYPSYRINNALLDITNTDFALTHDDDWREAVVNAANDPAVDRSHSYVLAKRVKDNLPGNVAVQSGVVFLVDHTTNHIPAATPAGIKATDTLGPPDTLEGRELEDDGTIPSHHQAYVPAIGGEQAEKVFPGTGYDHVTQTTEEYNVLRDLPIHPDISGHLSDYSPDSRADEEAHIQQWIDSSNPSEIVLCVLGGLGVGKSTLAKHLATRLRQDNRLAAQVFFSSALPDWDSESVAMMVAGQLCEAYPALARAVSTAILANPSPSLETRIQKFVLEPIRSLHLPRPLVVVLDALDLWDHRRILINALKCISTETHLVRFVVFGRTGVERHFTDVSIGKYDLPDASESAMRNYFKEKLDQIQWEYGRKPSSNTIDELVKKSKGLFIWSSTVCSLLGDRVNCPNPHDTLDAILQSQQSIGDSDVMANLYHDTIDRRFRTPDYKATFKVFLGALLVLQEPIPVTTFASLVSLDTFIVHASLAALSSIQNGPSKYDQDMVYPAASMLHSSHLEYFQSPNTPSHLAFPIDTSASHSRLGRMCLEELRRLPSTPQPDFGSPLQRYATRYWPIHTALGTPAVNPTTDVEWKATPHCSILDSLSALQWQLWAKMYLQLFHPSPTLETTYDTPQVLISCIAQTRAEAPPDAGISDAIALLEVAVRFQHRSPDAWLNLGSAYYLAAQSNASSSLLDSAVCACRFAAALGGDGGNKVHRTLANCLYHRSVRLGSREDLDEAISLLRAVLLLAPHSRLDQALSLNDLASYLEMLFRLSGSTESLDEAIELHRKALLLCPPDHPERSWFLSNLAITLRSRFEVAGTVGDLVEAIALQREALSLCPPGHLERSWFLSNLANSLRSHFELTHKATILYDAIALHREALSLWPPGHPDRTSSLNNLANALRSDFELTGSVKSLDEAIVLHRAALWLRPPSHPDRASSLNNLATALHSHSKLTGTVESLDEAIVLHREALSLQPPGHSNHALIANNLAASLHSHFELTGTVESQDEEITIHREALSLRPPGAPEHPWPLNNLATTLSPHFTLAFK